MSTPTAEHANLTKILNKIQALLDRADHPNTPAPEADSCRAKADELMAKYRIDEATRAATGQIVTKPIMESFVVAEFDSPYRLEYYGLFITCCSLVGIRQRGTYTRHRDDSDSVERFVLLSQMVGMESDVRYAQLLFTSLRRHMSETLEPKLDRSLSDQDNVYRMRSAGIERNRIAHLLWGSSMTDGVAHGKVAKLYKDACAARNEDPKVVGRGTNAKTYRVSFSEAYVARLRVRLRRSTLTTDNALPVLATRQERVDDEFYRLFPDERPQPTDEQQSVARRDCPKCKKAKSGYCRDHRPVAYRSRPHSSAGASAGYSAANAADIGPAAGSHTLESAR